MYYQDPAGRIIENSYAKSQWTLINRSLINSSVVTTAATPGSPLAAISYPCDGTYCRQVFFVSSTGLIMTATSKETIVGTSISKSWSASTAISLHTIATGGIGLAACWSADLFNGIRVFYASQDGYVSEVKYTFGSGDGGWEEGTYWDTADTMSGVACSVKEGPGEKFLNVYMRMTGTGAVKQLWNNYDDDFWNVHSKLILLAVGVSHD
jgi:hypothetical protein